MGINFCIRFGTRKMHFELDSKYGLHVAFSKRELTVWEMVWNEDGLFIN